MLAPQDGQPEIEGVVNLNPNQHNSEPRLRVSHSSRFASGPYVEAHMHAHLFPFGRGHTGETHRTIVSKQDCIRCYAMLTSRRFAHDPTFMLSSFARLSKENVHMRTSVKCKRLSSVFNGFETISSNDLAVALINNQKKQRGQARIDTPNPNADRFLDLLRLGLFVFGGVKQRDGNAAKKPSAIKHALDNPVYLSQLHRTQTIRTGWHIILDVFSYNII